MRKRISILLNVSLTVLFLYSSYRCNFDSNNFTGLVNSSENDILKDSDPILGCDGQEYVLPKHSPYVLPYRAGSTYETGLTNCSSSYHASGNPDEYAFDFNMPLRTEFIASRGGTVYSVEENSESKGSTSRSSLNIVGNYVIIDHGDETFGIYLHSPDNGIFVKKGDVVKQGKRLGVTGQSGLAGYPHLHFIVVKGSPIYPYKGKPISFKNAIPYDVILKSHNKYKAIEYSYPKKTINRVE